MITYIAIVNNLCVCQNRVTCQGYVGICSCHLSVIIKVQMNPSLLKKKNTVEKNFIEIYRDRFVLHRFLY